MTSSGQSAPVNGIDMYVERSGGGDPLLLLHGGGGAGVNWRLIFDSAPQGYELLTPDAPAEALPVELPKQLRLPGGN